VRPAISIATIKMDRATLTGFDIRDDHIDRSCS
jgi:hypothetical protein